MWGSWQAWITSKTLAIAPSKTRLQFRVTWRASNSHSPRFPGEVMGEFQGIILVEISSISLRNFGGNKGNFLCGYLWFPESYIPSQLETRFFSLTLKTWYPAVIVWLVVVYWYAVLTPYREKDDYGLFESFKLSTLLGHSKTKTNGGWSAVG